MYVFFVPMQPKSVILCTENTVFLNFLYRKLLFSMLPPDIYKRIKNIPITGSSLVNELARYRGNRQYLAGANKLFSLERLGEIIRLKRGLYVFLNI